MVTLQGAERALFLSPSRPPEHILKDRFIRLGKATAIENCLNTIPVDSAKM